MPMDKGRLDRHDLAGLSLTNARPRAADHAVR